MPRRAVRRASSLAALLLLVSGCITAPADPDWEPGPSRAEVFVPGAGDEECSIPGLFDSWLEDRVPQACCLVHDPAYEMGCELSLPEHDRAAADFLLAWCVIHEGQSEAIARAVLEAVRVGGRSAWHCDESERDGRITDEPWPE